MGRQLVAALAVAAFLSGCAGGQAAQPHAPDRPRLFLAGDGELWVVDVAPDRARRFAMPQLAPGDPPVRIIRRGDGVALWGYDVWRLDARRPERPPRRIARGWFFIASTHPDRLWVAALDPASPATVRALRAVREITVDGAVTVADVRPPRGAWPHLAVGTGLLFATRAGGWYLWDPAARRVVRRWPPRALGAPGDAHRDLLASCVEPCTALRLTDVRSGATRRAAAPAGWKARIDAVAFAPDGATLAVPLERRDTAGGTVRLALVEVATGALRVVPGTDVPAGSTFARWSSTGRHVFLTGGRRSDDRAIVAYRLGRPRARRLEVEVGDFHDATAY